jgi:competence protein ComEC
MKASVSLLSKTPLFETYRQQIAVYGLLFLLFLTSVFFKYQDYQDFTQFGDYTTNAWVEKQYIKNGHWVLKLQSSEGLSFYTISKEDLKPLKGYTVEIKLFTKGVDFLSYVRGFYAHSSILSLYPAKQKRYELMQELESLHDDAIAPLFSALFFAGPLPKPLRDRLSALGINHLLAISGFHVGVLSFVLFFIVRMIYKPIQGRYFPYRHGNRDSAAVVLTLLFFYLYFLDFTPSLTRAFAMSVFAYFLYDRGVKILSFSSLLLVISFLIALWPALLFSLGFWFSCAGVFFIFLFLHHMQGLKPWQSFLLLHLWVYAAMLPFVHYFYGSFSLHQLFSPLLTMLFILFYPLELFLHLIGQGARLDFIVHYLLSLEVTVIELFIPFWAFLLYLALSLLGIFSRYLFALLGLFCFTLLAYFFYRVAQL